jgi:predicted dehydrogenase
VNSKDASTIRWGILGAGAMSATFASGLAKAAGASVHAVASRSLAPAQAFAERVGVARAYGSYDELLADPDVDVVYIATVNTSHRDLCIRSIEHGKPVLCEKPFTLNAAEAREVVARARERKVFCMEAMWTRFLPAVVKLKELLAAGEIGTPRFFSASIGYAFEWDASARHFDPAVGGGALLDLGVYPISMAFHLFGPPTSVEGRASIGASGVDEVETIVLTHSGGCLSSLSASLITDSTNSGAVMGTLGRIELQPPLVRPEGLTVHRVTPIPPGGTGRAGSGRLSKLKESAFVRAANRKVGPMLAAVKGGKGGRYSIPCDGNGYGHQAVEVMRCLRAGLLESPIMPLDESVAIMETMDELRRQWGVRFPHES